MKKFLILFSVLFMLISCQQPNVSSPNVSSPSVNTEEQQLNQLLSSGVLNTYSTNVVIQHYTVTCNITFNLSEDVKEILIFDYAATGCLSNRHIFAGGCGLTFDFEKKYSTLEEAAAFDSSPEAIRRMFIKPQYWSIRHDTNRLTAACM